VFDPRMVDKVVLARGFLRVLRFSSTIIIPPILYDTHISFIYHERYIILVNDSIVK